MSLEPEDKFLTYFAKGEKSSHSDGQSPKAKPIKNLNEFRTSSDFQKSSESSDERLQRLASLRKLWDNFVSGTKETDKSSNDQCLLYQTEDKNDENFQVSSEVSERPEEKNTMVLETMDGFRAFPVQQMTLAPRVVLRDRWDDSEYGTNYDTDESIQNDCQCYVCQNNSLCAEDEDDDSFEHLSRNSGESEDMSTVLTEPVEGFNTMLCFSPLDQLAGETGGESDTEKYIIRNTEFKTLDEMKNDAMRKEVYEVLKKIESYVEGKSEGALASLVEKVKKMLIEEQNNVRQCPRQKEKVRQQLAGLLPKIKECLESLQRAENLAGGILEEILPSTTVIDDYYYYSFH
ncbi:hypothetical protein CAEBREN_14896 [Caenorhabditis brenneri]|uniref:Uncharacterized protein n=1 Tax=Caenorhabditis brenneri TaxID=135651 RepID=G0MQQ6_CAEBE|nr:hypothetical protein CAEBREN_14896 [Caenorhabditis brenneri]